MCSYFIAGNKIPDTLEDTVQYNFPLKMLSILKMSQDNS